MVLKAVKVKVIPGCIRDLATQWSGKWLHRRASSVSALRAEVLINYFGLPT